VVLTVAVAEAPETPRVERLQQHPKLCFLEQFEVDVEEREHFEQLSGAMGGNSGDRGIGVRDVVRRATHEARQKLPPARASSLDPRIKELILRLGMENPGWGYLRIRGELLKLGFVVSATTIATLLRPGGLGPASRRIGPT
jgi:hypothetical protein